MNFYKDLWKNKVVVSLIASVIVLIILSIFFPNSILQNLTTQLSIITALLIPFIMKGVEKKDKEKNEKEIVMLIIRRIKDYFESILLSGNKSLAKKFSSSMPFFRFMSKKFPEITIKVGIEINFEKDSMNIDSSELYILDKYCLQLIPFFRLILIENNKDIIPDIESFGKILTELIEHVNDVFPYKINRDLAKIKLLELLKK